MLLILAAPAAARAPVESPAEFAKLTRPVSFTGARVLLGEFLDQVSAQARVPIAIAPGSEWATGLELTVRLKEQPSRDVLTAIQELLTHHYNSAEWKPGKTSGFVLEMALPAEVAARRAMADMMEQVGIDLRRQYAVSKMPRELRPARSPDEGDTVSRLRRDPVVDLLAALTPQQLEWVLSGRSVVLPTAGLPIDSLEEFSVGSKDLLGSARQAEWISFFMMYEPDGIMPEVWIQNGRGNNPGVRTNLAGGSLSAAAWLNKRLDGWSAWSQPALMERIAPISYRRIEFETLPSGKQNDLALQLAERFKLNLIAEWEPFGGEAYFSGQRLTKDARQSLEYLAFAHKMMLTRSADIEILRSAKSIVSPHSRAVPWQVIKRFRESAAKNDGHPDLDTMAPIAQMTPDQQSGLGEEYILGRQHAEDWLPILAFYNRLSPDQKKLITSERGLNLSDTGLNARRLLLSGAEEQGTRNLPLLNTRTGQLVVRLWVTKQASRQPDQPGEQTLNWAIVAATNRSVPMHLAQLKLDPMRKRGELPAGTVQISRPSP